MWKRLHRTLDGAFRKCGYIRLSEHQDVTGSLRRTIARIHEASMEAAVKSKENAAWAQEQLEELQTDYAGLEAEYDALAEALAIAQRREEDSKW